MSGRVFLDTNVLVYADDADAGAKRDVARAIIEDMVTSRRGVLSTQVLQEYFVVAMRKLGIDPAHVQRTMELHAQQEVVVVGVPLIVQAVELHRLHRVSFWDALIIRAAESAACETLLTEDLNHGATIAGVRIHNPFL